MNESRLVAVVRRTGGGTVAISVYTRKSHPAPSLAELDDAQIAEANSAAACARDTDTVAAV